MTGKRLFMQEDIQESEIKIDEQIELKVCIKCLIEKPISEFSKNSRSKDGLRATCKECAKMAKKPNLIGRMCKKLGLSEEQTIIVLIIIETILIVVLELIR